MMKAQSTGKNLNINLYPRGKTYGVKTMAGMATLEILIAFTMLILCITAIILVVFSNQSFTVDSEINNEAISKAKKVLEDARAQSRQDFTGVTSSTSTETSGPLTYNKNLTVTDMTSCKKQATSTVSWSSGTRNLHVTLSTFLSDVIEALALGGDCDSEPPTDWDNPITAASVSIGGQGATDIDVQNNFVYLTSDPSAVAKEDFYIYKFDPATFNVAQFGEINISGGLNDVDTIHNTYAFATNTETTNNLVVFDVSDPSNPTRVASRSLPNMTTGVARSIFYYNDFVYVGTQYLACPPTCLPIQNNEFHIYNVSDPTNPVWRGSFNVNHNINDIVVGGKYAYLATSDDSGEVHIYDISNPSNISFEGLFDAPGNEDGKALYRVGNKLYVGRDRTPAARKDFYVLDISNVANLTELGSKNLDLNPGSEVRGIAVRSNLAFIGLDNAISGLQILDISNPSTIVNHPVCTTMNFSENSSAIDMDNNFIFSANISNDEMRIIHDQTSTCS